MIQEELTKKDKIRVNNCDYYRLTKDIMKSHEAYKDIGVGEVYFIKQIRRDGTYSYVSRIWGKDKKDKYMVFHKDDDGFVFLKRINVSGKLGVEIYCLTTQFPMPRYEIEPDPEYLDAILFEDEGKYDPLKAEKELNSRKGKARRKNKKLEIRYLNNGLAYAAIKEFKVGDFLYNAKNTYGSDIEAWKVVQITNEKVNKEQTKANSWSNKIIIGKTREDRAHISCNFDDVITLTIQSTTNNKRNRTLIFEAFNKYGHTYYRSKPYTTDDV